MTTKLFRNKTTNKHIEYGNFTLEFARKHLPEGFEALIRQGLIN